MIRRTSKVPPFPVRARDANKGDCGRVLIVGGSRGMIGAPCLAARAAGRGGAGLVKVAVPECLWDVAALKGDEYLTAGLPATRAGALAEEALEPLLQLAAWADVVVLGPGLGTAAETVSVVRRAVSEITKPLVLDADGLNAFAGRPANLTKARATCATAGLSSSGRRAAATAYPLVLTPHPGEMARLLNSTPQAVQKDREAAALACAGQTGAVVILKGAGTIVTGGGRLYVNLTGNPGMATGGTGDVLSGLLGALIGQGMEAFDAACLAVYLHGLAGDLAAKRLGVWSLVAGDLLEYLPAAFIAHARRKR
jgi:hydroxyethylthiazole kinase-like uncharacterized protein yjeF